MFCVVLFLLNQIVRCQPVVSCTRNWSSKQPIDDSDIVHLEDSGFISIPEYPSRPDEPLEKRKQRLATNASNVFKNNSYSVLIVHNNVERSRLF